MSTSDAGRTAAVHACPRLHRHQTEVSEGEVILTVVNGDTTETTFYRSTDGGRTYTRYIPALPLNRTERRRSRD